MKNTNIAKVLKQYRKENQYSVNDVSYLLDKRNASAAPKTIYGWESGHTQPDADTLLLLCEIYKIDDILATFGYTETENDDFPISTEEKQLILHYRKNPTMHVAIQKLLEMN